MTYKQLQPEDRKKWRLYHGPITTKPNISDRPEAANNRSEYGHWELDLFHGSKDDSKYTL